MDFIDSLEIDYVIEEDFMEEGRFLASIMLTTKENGSWDSQVLASQSHGSEEEAAGYVQKKMYQAREKVAQIFGIKPYENEFNKL